MSVERDKMWFFEGWGWGKRTTQVLQALKPQPMGHFFSFSVLYAEVHMKMQLTHTSSKFTAQDFYTLRFPVA